MSVQVENEQVKKFMYYLKVTFSIDVVLMRLTRGLKQHEASGINKEELLVSRDLKDKNTGNEKNCRRNPK